MTMYRKSPKRGSFFFRALAFMAILLLSVSLHASEGALKDPSKANEKAPDTFKVKFMTTKGDFVIEANRSLAPVGVDRFYNLVKIGFYDGAPFYRVLKGFVVQFGFNGNPEVDKVWNESRIKDDPVLGTNGVGTVTFAKSGQPDSRTTQLFINLRNNANLDPMGFAPFGSVVEGFEIVEDLYGGYGEGYPRGTGPNQLTIRDKGNDYLKADYPKLDTIKKAVIVE